MNVPIVYRQEYVINQVRTIHEVPTDNPRPFLCISVVYSGRVALPQHSHANNPHTATLDQHHQ